MNLTSDQYRAGFHIGLWLEELIDSLVSDESRASSIESPLPGETELKERTQRLMNFFFGELRTLAQYFNKCIEPSAGRDNTGGLSQLTITELTEVQEKPEADSASAPVLRFRISSQSESLSAHGSNGYIQFHLVPVSELFRLPSSETPNRLLATVAIYHGTNDIWTIDGLPTEPDQFIFLLRTLFKRLVIGAIVRESDAAAHKNLGFEGRSESAVASTKLKQLVSIAQNMAQKVVSQQEEIQNRIARDLHDAVIADIMLLKQNVGSDNKLPPEQIANMLDQIGQHIREICHDLAPRDLKDWGLKTVIEDLLERIAERTNTDCSFECSSEFPDLPYPVQLHIFRIVQECLNNVEKHAGATKISVKAEVVNGILLIVVWENGRGLPPNAANKGMYEGGVGLNSIRERAAMIRCFYPTKLEMESAPGKGTMMALQVRFATDTRFD